ncbi:c-type cytochrome [Flavobacteriaceae bacterium M23B6Z8]
MITFVAFYSYKKALPQCATQLPQAICGNENILSDTAQKGKSLFLANCAACHQLHKRMTGPGLKGLVQNDRYPSEAYFYTYIRNEQELIEANDAYAIAINKEYTTNYMHQFKLTDKQVEQLLAYISE